MKNNFCGESLKAGTMKNTIPVSFEIVFLYVVSTVYVPYKSIRVEKAIRCLKSKSYPTVGIKIEKEPRQMYI